MNSFTISTPVLQGIWERHAGYETWSNVIVFFRKIYGRKIAQCSQMFLQMVNMGSSATRCSGTKKTGVIDETIASILARKPLHQFLFYIEGVQLNAYFYSHVHYILIVYRIVMKNKSSE